MTPADTVAVKETAAPTIITASETVTATPVVDQGAPTVYPWTAPGVRAGGPDLREFDEKIANVRRDKESAIDAHDFDRVAHLRDYERQLLGQKNETLIAAPPVTGSHRRPWPKPAAAVSLIVVLAAVALVALHHTSSPAKITPADLAVPYHSPDGYSISPPAGWSARGYPSLSAAFVAPTLDNAVQKPFVDNLNVVVAPTPLTLGSTISQEKQQNPSYLSNYTIVTDQPTTLPNGQTAHLLGGTFDWPNGGELENIQLVLVNAGKEYAVTFTSSAGNFNNNYDLARASLSSFTLK